MITLNRSTTERLEPMSFYKQCYYNRCKAEQSRNSKLGLCKLHDENAEKILSRKPKRVQFKSYEKGGALYAHRHKEKD